MEDEKFKFISGPPAEDTRSQHEKDKDMMQSELVASAATVNWVEKKKSDFKRYKSRDQKWSGSCVAQTMAKIISILIFRFTGRWIDVSATSIYQPRSTRPAAGMIGIEAFEIARKVGASIEALLPSQNMTDAEMDSAIISEVDKELGAAFRIGNHIGINSGDFELLASTLQATGKPVMTWFYFQTGEWFGKEFPHILNPSLQVNEKDRHSVVSHDFGLIDGKKYIAIDDSAHDSIDKHRDAEYPGERFISEEFYNRRNFFARYAMKFRFEEGSVDDRPRFIFTKLLKFQETNDDIVALQKILRYEGLFPVNVDTTGYYGAVTADAVLKWQKKHTVAPDTELDNLAGRTVGPKTISKLNSLYGV